MLETADELTQEEYDLFRRLVYEKAGINLGDQKMQLVRARLGKSMRAGGFRSYRAYYEHVLRDTSGRELATLLDSISTNTTHLFREPQHFQLLHKILRDWAKEPKWRAQHHEVRIWSAACSSGEEPHSIAMTAHDALSCHPGVGLRVLATDISNRVLERARAGCYEAHRLGTVPQAYLRRYFHATRSSDGLVQIVPELARVITFARLNLMEAQFPFRHAFHVIFCRNVMIYFDRGTQQSVINKLSRHLQPGGYLLIGHSESLNAIQHTLRYVQPTVYQQPTG